MILRMEHWGSGDYIRKSMETRGKVTILVRSCSDMNETKLSSFETMVICNSWRWIVLLQSQVPTRLCIGSVEVQSEHQDVRLVPSSWYYPVTTVLTAWLAQVRKWVQYIWLCGSRCDHSLIKSSQVYHYSHGSGNPIWILNGLTASKQADNLAYPNLLSAEVMTTANVR